MQPCVRLLLNWGDDGNDGNGGDGGDGDGDGDGDGGGDGGGGRRRLMEISTMSIRGRVVRELSAEQLSCGPRLQTEVAQKLSPIKFGHFPFLTFTAPHCQ